MKSLVFALCVFVLSVPVVFAQESAELVQPMPEKIGVIYYLDSATNLLASLPKEETKIKVGSRALGFAGQYSRVELKGISSGLNLTAGTAHEFFMRDADPS